MSRKTIVAVYDTHQDAKNATEALYRNGFTNEEVSFVASDVKREYYRDDAVNAVDHAETATHRAGSWAVTGGIWGGLAGLVAGLAGLTLPGVGPIIVAGPLGAMLGGALTGALAGGILGGLTGLGIPDEEAHVYAEGLRRGGTLVSVTIPEERVALATSTLDEFHPVDIDERAASWKKEGWTRFDENATAYVPAADPVITGTPVTTGTGAVTTTTTSRSRSYGYPQV